MTRQEAMATARLMYGDEASISSDELLPRLVWKIGAFAQTIGRGNTWEEAIANTKPAPKEVK